MRPEAGGAHFEYKGRMTSHSRAGGLILAAIVVGLAAAAVFAPISTGRLGLVDFQVYWAGARVLLHGGNPYDRATLIDAYFDGQPPAWTFDPAWNPPWLLLMLTPLAALPAETAGRIWLLFNFALLLATPFVVWQLIDAPDRRRAPPWLMAVGAAFGSALTLLAMGQVTMWVLAGLLLAVAALKQRRDGWAGAALLLTLSKPQLVYLAVPLILIWATWQRRWRVWAGLLAAGALTTALVTMLAPGWLVGYWNLTSSYDFFKHSAATVGGLFQAYTGSGVLRLAGVPTLLLIPRLARLMESEGVLTGVNVALLISVPLAPYGWSFDQVIMLPAVVELVFRLQHSTDRRRGWYAAGLLATYALLLAMKTQGAGDFLYAWVPLAIGGLYAAVRRMPAKAGSSGDLQ